MLPIHCWTVKSNSGCKYNGQNVFRKANTKDKHMLGNIKNNVFPGLIFELYFYYWTCGTL